MLVLCNGAFKSGSTWLHAIVKEMLHIKKVDIEEIPERFWLHADSPTKIIESKLINFLSEYQKEIQHKVFLTKSHFFRESTHKRKYSKDVFFLFIRRDIGDAVVSHYHHFINTYRIKISFNVYYYLIGRYKAYEIILFNKVCSKYHQEDLFFSFENLKNNFEGEVLRIAKIIGLGELSQEEISIIKINTSLSNMRNQSKLKLSKYYPNQNDLGYKQFRKGLIGESELYFSKRHNNDIDKIKINDISLFTRIVYYFLFTLRRKIGGIE